MRTTALLLAATVHLAACGGGNKASPQPPASNTGFFAIVTASGQYKLYMPAPVGSTSTRATLAVVDAAAAAGSNGVLRYLDLGVDGAPQAAGGSAEDVVAVDASTPTVYFVDAATDTVRGTATLPPWAQPIVSSNNSSYSMGVAVDATRRRAWASVSYGLLEYDLDRRTLTATYDVPPPENFAVDPVAGRILSPFYLCDPIPSSNAGQCVSYTQPPLDRRLTDSLNVIDLASHTVYELVDAADLTSPAPLGFEPDAVAFDSGLGVAVLAIESPSTLRVLDLGATRYDGAALTCSVPSLATAAMPGPSHTAVAVDSLTHLAVAAQELDAGIVFLDLVKAKQGVVSKLEVTMPDQPDGLPWVGRADPHGAGIGVIEGRPYAFLVSRDRDWLARIDLRGVAGVMAGTGTFASQVSYISVPTPP